MAYTVIFSPAAERQITDLHDYIAVHGSQMIADRFISELLDYLDGFIIFPERGNRRDDIRPGLRITHFRHRTVIAFAVDDEQILIAGIYHGGQSYD
ncbi:type II toxin-antitoxin system RelE/ParE family toxin [Erwinia tracheiphila]|uniref:Plasmid stabilization protein n=1 Tax=Erwinia tracheiphila TaxID=65700 RepID=A0A0M2K9P0_9GAMM|nr:type II toxin-antitoxin system RelE/ParE family toxin [Erwinia tracheiphila]EOS92901.1 hypothetical protein ETR_22004 [Erwinia tracheiphila PSU-1]KKF35654.1 plasmid stabilization protein [Erwinia tracheiphila]UIA89828.1 type II toxin-antitoxin system RelE/ParE family toxin [Erwinia tracheiphila]UIA98130.1 type II toxin-antitoxin system RelE/ParE family toxin [Erwinia tracheiphila]